VDGGKQFFKDNDEQLRGEFLIRTKLALRQHALGTSRPRREGSVDERPGKIAGPPLTHLARQALGGRNARLLKRKEWCARNTRGKRKK